MGTFTLVWVGVRGALAYERLASIENQAAQTFSDLSSEQQTNLERLGALADDAAVARGLTSDPVWALSESLPWIGPQLTAVSTVSASADELLGEGLVPLAEAAGGLFLRGLQPNEGRIDLDFFTSIAAPAQRAASAATDAASAVQNIDRSKLVGVVGAAVDRTEEVFTRSADAVDALSRAGQLLPDMLGQDGHRSYLFLVQNNAEWRSLGGITGTAILMEADGGRISLVDTRSATSLSRGLRGPVGDLPQEVTELYDTRPARYFHNLTQVPDFPLDGLLARDMYQRQTGISVDGVVAVDPVLLSYLLHATGPVPLPDGSVLTPENAVPLLLNEVYSRFPEPEEQDAFFRSSTQAVFSALLDGRGSGPALLAALARGAEERRVLVWSAAPSEQEVLAGTSISGELPQSDAHTARFGVYLNDGTGSKMSYFVQPAVSVTWGRCGTETAEEAARISLHVELSNTAPADAAVTLPTYVTGNGGQGTPPGSAKIVSNIFLPSGFRLISANATNGSGYTSGSMGGHQVLTYGATVGPQQSEGFTIEVEGVSSAVIAEAVVTPTADPSLTPTVSAQCRGAGSGALN
ncbi:DUF4012 domain-containing protein [Microbacterium enclense]|uniref:DUF4012 domain-containing protein n=1 Tax=Microbacterium enclense TaxID=993073 RepID=UPI003F7DC663